MHGFDPSVYRKFRIKCKILSKVKKEMVPFTAGPLIISYVSVQVLEPEALKRDNVELILQSRFLKKYNGPEEGDVWRDVGSTVEVTAYLHLKSVEYYLYPEEERSQKSHEAGAGFGADSN